MEASTRKRKKKKNPSSPVASISKRESTRKKRVHRDPGLLKVQDALEHIIVTGAKVRRDNWRRHEFEQREENRSTPNELECPPLTATKDRTKATISSPRKRKRSRPSETSVCHAEDLRLYGKRHDGLPPFTTKTAQSGTEQDGYRESDDSEWNFEHGDSIPPILFRMARLSGEYPSEEQLSRFTNPTATLSKSFTSTDITLPQHDIPRALIEKCWERAVHIASNTMIVPVGAAPISTADASQTDSSKESTSPLPFNNHMAFDQESCREKCESLGIDIESLRMKIRTEDAISETTCPRCTRSFATTDELHNHYYGTRETSGCCRALIRPRHLDLIQKLLQNYAISQTDHLATILLSHNRVDDKTTNHKREEHLNWRDVQQRMEHAVKNSAPIPNDSSSNSPHSDTRHPVQQSIDIIYGATDCNDGEEQEDEETNSLATPPLMLNPMVLDAVHRRLIDRYADIPP